MAICEFIRTERIEPNNFRTTNALYSLENWWFFTCFVMTIVALSVFSSQRGLRYSCVN